MKVKDILRCSITCESVEATKRVFEWITSLDNFEVVEVKNGFKGKFDPVK
jgi:hypothetical protein